MVDKKNRNKDINKVLVKVERQKEEAFKARKFSEQQFGAIAGNVVDAIISIDENRQIIYWNKAAELFFGYKPEEIIGKDVTLIMPERYKLRHTQGVKRYLETKRSKYLSRPINLEGLRKDGTEFPLELAVKGWQVEDKHFFTAIIRDTTERRKMENELEKAKKISDRIAETLQESLIKPVPKIPKVKIATTLHSAYESERVGGDFYDVFEVGENQIAILIGDIAGKGVKAAGLTETVRSSVRTLAYIDPSPSFVFDKTSQALIKQIPLNMFATSIYMVVNIKTGIARFSSAGHPPPILCSSNKCKLLESPPGYPLGTYIDFYEEIHFTMEKNDTLILYTDGLVEAKSNHKPLDEEGVLLWGEEGVLKSLEKVKSKSPKKMIDFLIHEATDFSNGQLQDDIGIVAFRI